MSFLSVRFPNYLQSFTCVGEHCPDTCCSGYKVSIDQRTYEKYKAVDDLEIKNKIEMYLFPESDPQELLYASIHPDTEKNCPFLTENKQCGIQKKLGEQFLGNACFVYPRRYNKVGDHFEKSASPSCPEIARLLLPQKEGLFFINSEENDDTHLYYHQEITKEQKQERDQLITLLQNRKYSLLERMKILKEKAEIKNNHFEHKNWEKLKLQVSNFRSPRFLKVWNEQTLEPSSFIFEYMLENYLVNYVFSKVYPYTIGLGTVTEQCRLLSTHFFNLQRLMMHSSIQTEERMIQIIQSYSKVVENDPQISLLFSA